MTPLTPFIGRQADLHKLQALLQEPSTRLVSILGSGGIGKTRLALELLEQTQASFPHGATFIPLAQLSSAEAVLPALADRLGVPSPPGGDLKQALLEHLSGRQSLLLLDNFEHLLEAAWLVRDILAAAPGVKILVTSREKLGLECECLYRLSGLELPPQADAEIMPAGEAVQLFLQKARQVQPDFSLTPENRLAVRQICEHVNGNPLGLLLAAAWVELFSPAEILAQIRQSLDFLSRQARDADSRHSSMRAVFEASFQRLDEPQQAVLRRLAFFRGGFDLAAARAVAGADLPSLINLVDRSMLGRDPARGRYDLHELLRQYAGEKLEAAGESRGVQAAHARYYLEWMACQEASLTSPQQNATLDAIQADFDNLRQAFAWAVESRDIERVRLALPGLYAFCDHRSRFYEGAAIFHQACRGLAPSSGEPPHPAWALALLSWYDMRTYHEPFASFEEITSMAEACLKQARARGDQQGLAASLVLLGAVEEDQLEYEPAIRRYEQALQACLTLDDIYWITMRIGLNRQAIRQYDQAIRAFEACLERAEETGEQVKRGWSLVNLGETLFFQNKVGEARNYLEQGLESFTEVGTEFGMMWAHHSLGRLEASLGQPVLARTQAQEALRLAQKVHSSIWIGKSEALLSQIVSTSPAAPARVELGPDGLSPREQEVLDWLKSDLTGPEIADRLVVSLNTVRFHTKNIYQKLGVKTRLEAIRRAKELDL